MAKLGENAVVLGASMGGLLAAGVLAEFYETVTVVERDVCPTTPANQCPSSTADRVRWPVAKALRRSLSRQFSVD